MFLSCSPVFSFVSQLLTSVRLCFSVAHQCSIMFLSCSPVFDYVSQLLASVRFCFSVARQCSVLFLSCSPVFGYVSQLLASVRLCFSVAHKYSVMFLSNSAAATATSALRLHAAGLTIFAVGVGAGPGRAELETIASKPPCLHIFSVDNFDRIGSIKNSISRRTCEGEDDCISPFLDS